MGTDFQKRCKVENISPLDFDASEIVSLPPLTKDEAIKALELLKKLGMENSLTGEHLKKIITGEITLA